jgi:hypothetical protein
MFSSIEVEDRSTVIERCYWPLLKLTQRGFKIGIELTGLTLEIINDLDPLWVMTFQELLAARKVELIGSGYSQIIGPLVPARVNYWNQKLGLSVYGKVLGISPIIALVNEMAYSASMVEVYQAAGYQAIIMEWNNPRRSHPDWDRNWKYAPQIALGTTGSKIPLIWSDSIGFQKFQRYAHGENELDTLKAYISEAPDDMYYPLYSSDAEIFDYRPGRFKTETLMNRGTSEWDKIVELYEELSNAHQMIFPSEVLMGLDSIHGGHDLKLESAQQPIPVKKQEKYNINRWALTGRGDVSINTSCYKIFNILTQRYDHDEVQWRDLCYLWSSDFRTHIGKKRWEKYQKRLSSKLSHLGVLNAHDVGNKSDIDSEPNMGTLNHSDEVGGRLVTLANEFVKLELIKRKGMALRGLTFNQFGDKPLLGTLEHGFYEDISFGADFYSGHFVIERANQHKVTDLVSSPYSVVKVDGAIRQVQISAENSSLKYSKRIVVNNDCVTSEILLDFPTRDYGTVRLGNFTFSPNAWDMNSLYYATHNGGNEIESFQLKNTHFNHLDILSALVSSKHGTGATGGVMIVGDKEKLVKISHKNSSLAMIPSVIFEKLSDDQLFLRVIYSIQESDETFRPAEIRQRYHAKWVITAEKTEYLNSDS